MSETRTEVISRRVDGHFWRRCRTLLALLVVGVVGATGALAMSHRENYPPQEFGWGALKGGLASAPVFILAFDQEFNVQGFFGPGGEPLKDMPDDKELPDAVVELTKFGTATIYCYKIDGKRECIEI